MMTARDHSKESETWVAIDIAKKWNTLLLEDVHGQRHRFKMSNTLSDLDKLVSFLKRQPGPSWNAMKPTGRSLMMLRVSIKPSNQLLPALPARSANPKLPWSSQIDG